MSAKEITLSARLDDAQLVQDFANVQKKVRQMMEQETRMAQGMRINQNLMGAGMPAMGQYSQQAYQQAYNQNNSSMRQIYAQEVEQLGRMEKIRDSLTKKLERQAALQAQMLAQGKEISSIENSRAMTAERLERANENIARKQTLLNGSSKLLRPNMGGGEAYGPPNPPAPPGAPEMSMADVAGNLAKAGSIIAAIAKVSQTINAVYRGFGSAPIDTVSGMGSAVQGTTGREVSAIYSGRSAIENAYLPEKRKAAAMAAEMLKRNEETGLKDSLWGIAGATGAGAAAGTGVGALFGGVGAVPGALIGGGIGLLGSVGSALTNKQSMHTLLSPFSSTMASARQADLLENYAGDYNKSLNGLKEMNPLKKEASEQYNSNYGKYLQFQRQMGLNYNSFHGVGGFREYATQNGFSDDQAMGMSGQILGAGGSTGGGPNAASRNAVLGLQAERNFNLTNAGSILGKLSSVNSNSSENKEQLVRILAEGTKLGFDGSRYVEESRKFSQTVSEIVSRSGSGGIEDASRAARNFASFVADPTTTSGMEGARSAYQRFQEISSATTGAKGVIRASGLMGKEFSGMSQEARINLAGLSEEELTENNPIVTRAARESGMSVDDLINKVQKVNTGAMTRRSNPASDKIISDYQKKNKMTINASNFTSLPEDIQKAVETSYGGMAVDQQGKLPVNEAFSLLNRKTGGVAGTQYGPLNPNTEAQLTGQGKTGKVEDESIRAAAESADFILKNFRSMKDEIVPSAEAIHKFNQGLNEFVSIVNKMPKDFQAQIYAKMNSGTLGSETAPQGSTPSGK